MSSYLAHHLSHIAEHRKRRVLAADKTGEVTKPAPTKPDEMTWRDYLVMLLHIGSELEHGLMVQYLYAAYSLGGEHLSEEDQAEVQEWQDLILTVAREEMGHLLTVQNLLCVLGGPITFERENYPWDGPFYPFSFNFEPLTRKSLADYVFAEMPGNFESLEKFYASAREGSEGAHFRDEDIRFIEETVKYGSDGGGACPVGEVYQLVHDILAYRDPRTGERLIQDSDFRAETYPLQASWDDWGRGYRPNPSPPSGNGVELGGYDLRFASVASVDALETGKSSLVIVARVAADLHLRIFSGTGRMMIDKPECDLDGEDEEALCRLKGLVGTDPLPDPSDLSPDEKRQVFKDVKTCAGDIPSDGKKANVIIERMATRTEALYAIREIAGQGENPDLHPRKGEEVSHFARFVEILEKFDDKLKESKFWTPTRKVPTNPTTTKPADPKVPPSGTTLIEWPASATWADLFNCRYRMLLTYLTHTFRLAREVDPDVPNTRGAIMHRIFGEMYHLKSISGILVRMPLIDPADPEDHRAAPPFQLPYSLVLPPDEIDCWRLHRDNIRSSKALCDLLLDPQKDFLSSTPPEGEPYLRTLRNLDNKALAWVDAVLGGLRENGGKHP